MAKGSIGKRYAQAVFALADTAQQQEGWLESLATLEDVFADPAVSLYFGEPRIPMDKKATAVFEISKGLDPVIQKFLGVLVQKQATSILPRIVSEYRGLLDQSLGRIGASASSASPVSVDQKSRLEKTLSTIFGKTVIVNVREDPEIIGGLVVRVGDQIIDGSVRTRIGGLRQRLDRGTLS